MSWDKYISEALGEASKLAGKGVKFKDMPKWVRFRIRLFCFVDDITHPKSLWLKFWLWNFRRKHPYLYKLNRKE